MTRRSSRTAATQPATPQATGTKRKAGAKSTGTKTSSAPNGPSTAGTSQLFTAEQLAIFNSMQAQIKAQKKAATATQDEGMLVLIFTRYFDS